MTLSSFRLQNNMNGNFTGFNCVRLINCVNVMIGGLLTTMIGAAIHAQHVTSEQPVEFGPATISQQYPDEIWNQPDWQTDPRYQSGTNSNRFVPPILRRSDWRNAGDPNSVFFQQEAGEADPSIPEPMVFDLVRPLGAKKGELEINSLAIFPWRSVNRDPSRDPFGSGQTTPDRGLIEWAPEVEYAFADGWAIEFELPFEGSQLEAYKVALQGTFGSAFDGHYIHGFQWIVEPNTDWQRWNSTLLYLAGIRFDEKWSALMMLGGRMDLAGRNNAQTFERLFNATLFHEVNDGLTLGTELNHAVGNRGRTQTLIVPQFHYDISRTFQLQSGIGVGLFDQGSEQSVILRVIWSRE